MRDDFSYALEKRDEAVMAYHKELKKLQEQNNP
jgi:hypothetical protein